MKNDHDVRIVTESEHAQWTELAHTGLGGSIYATPEYLEVLCRATGGRFDLVGVFKGEELVGGAPLYIENGPSGPFVAVRTLLYYNGILLKDYDTKYPSERTSRHLAVLDALREYLEATPYKRLILQNRGITDLRPFISGGWRVRPAYTYVVNIKDPKAAFDRIVQNLRRLINRCEKSNAVFTDDDDFASFYKLHLHLHERKGAPIYLPEARFVEYFRALRQLGLCRLFQVRMADGRAVAGQVVLTGRAGHSYTVCAAADAEEQNLGTTPFLRWKALEVLSGLGFITNDLTDAALNPVTRFKSQLGGDLVMNLVLTRPDGMSGTPAGNPASALRSLAGKVMRRLGKK